MASAAAASAAPANVSLWRRFAAQPGALANIGMALGCCALSLKSLGDKHTRQAVERERDEALEALAAARQDAADARAESCAAKERVLMELEAGGYRLAPTAARIRAALLGGAETREDKAEERAPKVMI